MDIFRARVILKSYVISSELEFAGGSIKIMKLMTAVLTIKPRSLDGAEEELRSVGVGSGIGHGQNTRSSVLEGKVLVLKLVSINRLSSSSITTGKITW